MTYFAGHVPDFANRYNRERTKHCQCGFVAADWERLMAHCADPARDEWRLPLLFVSADLTSAGRHERDGDHQRQQRPGYRHSWVCECGEVLYTEHRRCHLAANRALRREAIEPHAVQGEAA